MVDMAVDLALDDPSAWTMLDELPTVEAVEPADIEHRETQRAAPARVHEYWYDHPNYPIRVSTRGRVRSKLSGRLVSQTKPSGNRKSGWRVKSKGRVIWVPAREVNEFMGWEG